MKSTLIDAGPIIALFDNSDQQHVRVLDFLKSFKGKLVSTWPVLTEASHMLDFSRESQVDFLSWVTDGGIEIHNLEQWQLRNLLERFETYSDLPADLADCTLLEVAESENITSIITLNRDFSVYKPNNGNYLDNLLNEF